MEQLAEKFDAVVEAMGGRIAELNKPYLHQYLEKVKAKREALMEALADGDEGKARAIIDQALAFAKELDAMEPEKGQGFLGGLFPARRRLVEPSPPKAKREAEQKAEGRRGEYDAEMHELRQELAKREVELEGMKGAYANLAAEIRGMRARMEEKEAKDIDALAKQVAALKTGLDSLHGTMEREFGASKKSYEDFASELLHVAIQVAEIQGAIDTGGTVEEVDVIELRNAVESLEKKLTLTEAREKSGRLELADRLEKSQKTLLGKVDSKADTAKIVNTMKAHVADLLQDIEGRDAKIAADLHVELKDAYYTLGEKMKAIEGKLEDTETKRGLQALKKDIASIGAHVEQIRNEELELEREVEQQHLSDEALMQRIDAVAEQVRKSGESGGVAMADIAKTVESLEMGLKARPRTEDVDSMRGSLAYLKGRIARIENAEGKARGGAVRPKGAAPRGKKAKAKAAKPRNDLLFNTLGGGK